MSINGICISASETSEFRFIEKLILKELPECTIIPFSNVLVTPELMDEVDYIFTVGGDGSVAWLVGAYYNTFENVDKLKPIVPVIRPTSIGYFRQLSMSPPEAFLNGLKRIIEKDYTIQNRTILETTINGRKIVAVNEITFFCEPHLGKYKILVENHPNYEIITETMADGAMIATSMGSTAWSLSHQGHVSLCEDSLELIFVGGIHSSANFTLPRKKVRIDLELKNPTVTKESIFAYNEERERLGLEKDQNASKTLGIVYGPRVIVDGKIQSFGDKSIEVNPFRSVPMLVLDKETVAEKARKLTKIHI